MNLKKHGNLYNIIGNCHIFINSVNHKSSLNSMTVSCLIYSQGTRSAMQIIFILYLDQAILSFDVWYAMVHQ